MGRCACTEATCQCVLQDTATVQVDGAGSADVPYELTIIPAGVVAALEAAHLISSTLHSSATPVGNVGPGVDVLANVNIPANTLNATGDRLRFRAMLTLDATAENNGWVFSYGGTPFETFPLAAPVDAVVIIEGEIIRTGAATQAAITSRGTSIPSAAFTRTNMAEDNTAANAFLVTGQSGGAGETNAVVLESLTIDVLPL